MPATQPAAIAPVFMIFFGEDHIVLLIIVKINSFSEFVHLFKCWAI